MSMKAFIKEKGLTKAFREFEKEYNKRWRQGYYIKRKTLLVKQLASNH